MTIYKKELLFEDVPFEIASILFKQRQIQKLSLEEVSRLTSVSADMIEALEIHNCDIDFEDLAKLLDFYGVKLEGYLDCFSGLPDGYYKNYFK